MINEVLNANIVNSLKKFPDKYHIIIVSDYRFEIAPITIHLESEGGENRTMLPHPKFSFRTK